jgi:sensor histidine kinase regulating citrate/malate metabolism
MKLQYKIMIFMTIIIATTLGIVSIFSFYEMEKNIKEQMSRNVLNTAATISSIQEIQDNIGRENGSDKIQAIVERIRLKTKVQFITVMDMNAIRYSHPLPEQIGKKFYGGDEVECLQKGQTYITEGQGTLGRSIRAFMPIYKDGIQIGAVCVGILAGDFKREFISTLKGFIPYLVLGLTFGVIGSILLSNSIKRTIFGLEPKEVASNLRAQNHEFMNKLHTISGLIQLDECDKAVEFIQCTTKVREDILETLGNNIKIPSLAGLLLSKYGKASENKINFILDNKSFIRNYPKRIKEDELICIVGNLIENSIDAVSGKKDGKIQVLISGHKENLYIQIANNGDPIPEELKQRIFERGTSTKRGIRGFGLNNVKQIVDSSGGTITFVTGEETVWKVEI